MSRLFSNEASRKFIIRCTRRCGHHVERLCTDELHVTEKHPDLPAPGGPGTTVEYRDR
jgi:hypothetical protein